MCKNKMPKCLSVILVVLALMPHAALNAGNNALIDNEETLIELLLHAKQIDFTHNVDYEFSFTTWLDEKLVSFSEKAL